MQLPTIALDKSAHTFLPYSIQSYIFPQAEEVLQNYTPQNVVVSDIYLFLQYSSLQLISSSVPKAEVLKETVLPGGLAWIYVSMN